VLSTQSGLQRFVWDLHFQSPPVANTSLPISATPRNTVREPRGPWVQPGQYSVRLTVDDKQYTQAFDVRMDPRVKTPAPALAQQYTASLTLFDAMNEAEVKAATGRAFADSIMARKAAATGDLPAALDAYAKKFVALVGAGAGDAIGSITGTLLPIMDVLQASDEAPTTQALRAADERIKAFTALKTQWTTLTTTELIAINAKLTAAGLAPLKIVEVKSGAGFTGSTGGNEE
jgi:hypothetical protein